MSAAAAPFPLSHNDHSERLKREAQIKEALTKIDKDLAKVHAKVRANTSRLAPLTKINGCAPEPTRLEETMEITPPTNGFSPSKFKKTRMAFQAMADDALVEDDAAGKACLTEPGPEEGAETDADPSV